VGNAKTTKSTRGMFNGNYISIITNGKYLVDLGKDRKYGKTRKRIVEIIIVG
jgi:hypothetical protein